VKRRMAVWLVLFGLLFSVSFACTPLPSPGTTGETKASRSLGESEGGQSKASGVASSPSVTMKNPAAVYCTDLGYEYQIVDHADGSQDGLCHLPDGSTCSAWDFLRGQCGVQYSICARRGLETVVRSDGGNPFSREYAVCTDQKGRPVQSATEMADLQASLWARRNVCRSGSAPMGPSP